MQKTLQRINELLEKRIIDQYAIAGGMAQFYYIEPSVTYDLDLIVHIADEEKNLNPLTVIYRWAEEHEYKIENEHIVIEGLPVQFLLAYNDLVKESLENRVEINIFNEKTYVLRAEYLMAIMLQTGRLTDRERLARFFAEGEYDNELFHSIIKRFGLEEICKNNYEERNG